MNQTTDYLIFYQQWERPVRGYCINQGFRNEDLSDMTQTIFERVYYGKYLEKFDPTIVAFSKYIWTTIRYIVLDAKRKLARRWAVEYGEIARIQDYDKDASTDRFDHLHFENRLFSSFGNDFGSLEELSCVELNETLAKVYMELSKLPSIRKQNFARLLSDIIEQVQETDRVCFSSIARKRGLSRQAVSKQAAKLYATPQFQELRLAMVA